MLLMHWTSSCTIKHDTETVRLYFIEAKDALVADGRCLLFLINFLFNFIRLFNNSSLKFEIMAKQLYVASQRVL